jgi:hypothetical protein
VIWVIEYRVDDQADIIRLITSLTDHEKYPAAELAALYARRWEIELVFDEIKTHQRGRPVVRSQTPDRVRQEIYAPPDRALCHPGSAGRSRPPASQYGRADLVHPGPARRPPLGDLTGSVTVCYPAAGPATAPARSARASPATAARPQENPPATTVAPSSSP